MELKDCEHTLIIDDEDYERVMQWGWAIRKGDTLFVTCTRGEHEGKRLSRMLLGITSDLFVDHRNGNTLDNRKINLRPATCSQNNANKVVNKVRDLPRGVVRHGTRFRARIKVNGVIKDLKVWATAEEAGKAYIQASEKYFGEFSFHLSRSPN